MIQVSTQTQVAESSQGIQGVNETRRSGAEKKDGLGVFAKLLAGLLKNTRQESGRQGLEAGGKAENSLGASRICRDEEAPGKELDASGEIRAEAAREEAPAGKKAGEWGRGRKVQENALRLSFKPAPEASAPKETGDAGNGEEDGSMAALVQVFDMAEDAGAMPIDSPAFRDQEVLPDEDALLAGTDEQAEGLSFEEMEALSEVFTDLAGSGRASGSRRGRVQSPFTREGDAPGERSLRVNPEFTPKKEAVLPAKENNGGGAAENRLDKQRDRRKDRLHLEVRDLRTGPASSQTADLKAGEGLEPKTAAVRETELTVDLVGSGKTQAEISADRESRPITSFQDMLARELHQNLNNDIVRHASIMLRDGGEGTIRLSLKPESLGTVKIRLEMAENKIAGRIIVESEEALRAFEREIRSLEQAFRDSGFDGASLETAVAGGNGQESRDRQGGKAGFQADEYTARIAAAGYGAGEDAPPAEEFILSGAQGQPLVNMLA